MKREKATVSYSSPKGGSRGCLCKDGRRYSKDCCDGSLQAQGIGSITLGETDSAGTITNIDTESSASNSSTEVVSQGSSNITIVDTTVTITNTSS